MLLGGDLADLLSLTPVPEDDVIPAACDKGVLKEHSGFDMERVDLSFRAFLLAV
jgi:hypothetical protein